MDLALLQAPVQRDQVCAVTRFVETSCVDGEAPGPLPRDVRVCAGKRGEVALGDVLVADRGWQYDTGKDEQQDIKMYLLRPASSFIVTRTSGTPGLCEVNSPESSPCSRGVRGLHAAAPPPPAPRLCTSSTGARRLRRLVQRRTNAACKMHEPHAGLVDIPRDRAA